ncbi:Sulfatase [Gimesia alba]|uniref:Sulfatase n=1 Tax=Gimesia alba TaxID=2527973 RepID=A0A517RBA0_9PLAN|nr:sulfatase-like hydrolase/transferase [Gimesia alba]QDT41151.1 Sulfatase [Gimesia alba]
MKKAFVVSFEQLPACMLGCYGHQWIETPNFDRLASLSVVFDQHFANDLSSQNSYPWWTGHTIPCDFGTQTNENDTGLFELLREQRIQSTLLLESDSEAGRNADTRAQETYFNQFDQVETVSGQNGFKVSEVNTPIAQLMQVVLKRLPEWMESSQDQLVWIRSEGVPLLPLAPEFFSTLYLDEVLDQGESEDDFEEKAELAEEFDQLDSDENSESDLDVEDWQELVTVVAELFTNPEEWSELEDHERQMARAVYAGYVTLLDQWFGRLLDQLLDYAESQSILLIVTAARGDSELLGPVRQVENWDLFEEATHVPLLIFDSENEQQGTRRQFLSQSADIPVSLLSWSGIPREKITSAGSNLLTLTRDQTTLPEPVIYAASDRAIALRTAEFYYLTLREERETPDSEEPPYLDESLKTQLYQKPSDHWDVYELHTQLPEIVAQMSALLDEKRIEQHDEDLS